MGRHKCAQGAGIDGAVHAGKFLWEKNKEDDKQGLLLVNVQNTFNEGNYTSIRENRCCTKCISNIQSSSKHHIYINSQYTLKYYARGYETDGKNAPKKKLIWSSMEQPPQGDSLFCYPHLTTHHKYWEQSQLIYCPQDIPHLYYIPCRKPLFSIHFYFICIKITSYVQIDNFTVIILPVDPDNARKVEHLAILTVTVLRN